METITFTICKETHESVCHLLKDSEGATGETRESIDKLIRNWVRDDARDHERGGFSQRGGGSPVAWVEREQELIYLSSLQ